MTQHPKSILNDDAERDLQALYAEACVERAHQRPFSLAWLACTRKCESLSAQIRALHPLPYKTEADHGTR